MAARWSNPSGGLGIQRFRVWPLGADSYSHIDLTNNFDEIDAIIGVPSSGNWPPTTGTDGGIYKEIQLLKDDGQKPIGEVFYWFRPSGAIPLPSGCVVCDGSILAPSDHDFPGIATSVTLPNLLNVFVLGADPNKSIGTPAAVVGGTGINTASGAPGPQATGGFNQITQTVNQMAGHDHGGQTENRGFNNRAVQGFDFESELAQVMFGTPPNALDGEVGNHTHVIDAQGGGAPMDNRPCWVGLIPLCKVRRITSL